MYREKGKLRLSEAQNWRETERERENKSKVTKL